MRVSFEEASTDLLVYRRNVQETKHKQANWQTKCVYTFSQGSERQAQGDCIHLPHKFGDATADHQVLSDGNESRFQHRFALVEQDPCTHCIHSYPTKNQTAPETMKCLQKFVPPDQKPGLIQSDNSLALIRLCILVLESRQVDLIPIRNQWNCAKHGPWTKKKVPLLFCFSPVSQDKLADRKSPHERRYGTPFDGPVMPLWTDFFKKQSPRKTNVVFINLAQQVLPGMFTGYAMNSEKR